MRPSFQAKQHSQHDLSTLPHIDPENEVPSRLPLRDQPSDRYDP
jgi:hypothetical protein